MSVSLDSVCLECHLGRNLKLARKLGTEAQAMTFARELMQLYLSAPEGVSSPWFSPATADIFKKVYGEDIDLYGEDKRRSNAFVMERFGQIKAKVETAPDPLFAGLQFAILGNYLDFAALKGEVSYDKLDGMLDDALNMVLDKDCYESLCRDLESGKKLLYLTDNAGEIGFDRIFAEEMAKKYPHLQITFCVRGADALNDATRQDAAAVGISFPVIDNGTRYAATIIEEICPEARTALEEADVIIAKGMANTETMLGCGYNVYYAFLVKCQRLQNQFGVPRFTPLIVKERQ